MTAGAQLLIERDDPELRPRLLHSLQQAGEQMQGLLESKLAHERTLTDGPRRIEIHEMQGSVHAQGFMMVWLPAEKILIQADAYTPGAPNTPPPAVPNGNQVNLVANVERLGLQPERILPLHSRMVAYSELLALIGRK